LLAESLVIPLHVCLLTRQDLNSSDVHDHDATARVVTIIGGGNH
jgi:hypothetical protein